MAYPTRLLIKIIYPGISSILLFLSRLLIKIIYPDKWHLINPTLSVQFISSQFCYCPLIWMCHSRKIHRQINPIHQRALCIIYMDNASSFDELLEKSESVSIHNRNQDLLVSITEICSIWLLKSIRPCIIHHPHNV